DPSDRVNPIRIPYDETVVKSITLNYPETWKPRTAFEKVDFENKFGRIEASYTASKGRLVIKQKVSLNKIRAPKEEIDALLEIMGSGSKLVIPHLVFEVTPN
ncbi:MAG: DUF3858 domain-containing protein, partial [Pseudomonadales bacterium]|nr:DUF3858 domain-containing protein [Pseudomonadales bacterium]